MTTMAVKLAKWAEGLGYNVAGFSDDLYEGAEFMRLPSYIDGDAPTEEELRYCSRGKVLEIVSKSAVMDEEDHYVIHFVYLTDDGTQISETFGKGLDLRFKVQL